MADATPSNPPKPAPAPASPSDSHSKFKLGQSVEYPACPDGTFGAGVGKVMAVDHDIVTVEITTLIGKQNKNFKETELTCNAN